jgi:hypothetical protein
MAEDTIYCDNNVAVTTARVIVSGTTYALRNITSVKLTTTPAKTGCAVVLIVLGVLGVLGALPTFAQDVAPATYALVCASAFLIVGIALIRSAKPSFHVTIASSSGEIRALTSTDRSYIETIVASINEAIVRYR